MDNVKDKYQMRFFLSTVAFILCFICAFYAIYYLESIFLIIPLVLIDVLLFFISYQSLMYRLALRKKYNELYNSKLNLNEYFDNKLKKKDKRLKVINKLLLYSLYGSPILIILLMSIGIFINNSAILALVLPALIIVYLIILFFVKDIYSSFDYMDEKELKEVVFINEKSITYKGATYIFNYCGFHIKDNTYKFLFIPLTKLSFDEETTKKIEEINNEVRSK